MVPPASCESPPLPSGRAARARGSDAFPLPPGCHCDRQGIGCHPRTMRVSFTAPVGARTPRPHIGTRPERRLHENVGHRPHIVSTSAPGVRRKTEPPRRYRKSNFSTVCGQICLRSRALANIHGGGDSQEGAKCPLLCACRAQRHFLPVMNWHIRRALRDGSCNHTVPTAQGRRLASRRPLRDYAAIRLRGPYGINRCNRAVPAAHESVGHPIGRALRAPTARCFPVHASRLDIPQKRGDPI